MHKAEPRARAPVPAAAPATASGAPRPGLLREAGQMLVLYALSATLLAWLFPPHGLWVLAFVGLVPWAVATCRTSRAWLAHWLTYFVGTAFFLVTLRWLALVTVLGYVALALYLAIYWTLAAWALRTARRHGISPAWTLPVVWVACEFLRATVMTGFPWLFLSHGLYAQLPLIQIADLGGAYAVSFVAALVNGVLVEAALRRWPGHGPRPNGRQLRAAAGVAAALLLATLGYGVWRLRQVNFDDPATFGPRVAVIQGDFPLRAEPPYSAHEFVILARYLQLGAEAARAGPDLVVFPETAWSAYQNIDFVEAERAAIDAAQADLWSYSKLCHRAVSSFARGDYADVNKVLDRLEESLQLEARMSPRRSLPTTLPRLPDKPGPPVTVVVGSVSVERWPLETYPKVRKYNSALVYDSDGVQRRVRYDKRHLVPFGELVPFRGGRLHWLYRRLNELSPFSNGGRTEYSLTPGRAFTILHLPTADRTYTFGAPICYEDVMPYVIREYTWDDQHRRVDFLVNISNDGWFQHSTELPQHLAICALRAVENRVGIARAVNTGASGFIDPNGRIHDRVVGPADPEFGVGVEGWALANVRLDTRDSLYGRRGDWLAWGCLLASAVLWLGGVFERWVLAIKHRIEGLVARRRSRRGI